MRKALTFVALAVLCPMHAGAQLREHGPLVLELPSSTRALALGGAFYLFGNDSDAVFFNPALLAGAEGISAAGQRFGAASRLGTVTGATDWASGGVGVGVQMLEYGAQSRGATELSADEGSLSSPGSIGAVEIAAAVDYGRTVKGVRVGIAGKLIDQRLGGRQDATGAVDVGAAADVGPARVGIVVQNLGPGMTFAEVDVPLPHRVTLGASTQVLPFGPLDLGWTAAVSRRADGTVVPGGGMEVAYWPVRGRTFTARVGLRRVPSGSADPFTFGGAFHGDKIVVEYGYQGYDDEKAAHRLGLSWR